LIGAAVTITNDDTSETILTTTWNGSTITTDIDVNTNYTVSVETIAGYIPCTPQSYQAGYQTERNISFQYRASGAFILDTDGKLTTASNWDSANNNKVVGIAVITEGHSFVIAPTELGKKAMYNSQTACSGATIITDVNAAKQRFAGNADTQVMLSTYGSNTTYATGAVTAYTFKNGKSGRFPTLGEFNIAFNNKTAINACISACGATAFSTDNMDRYWTSTYYGTENSAIAFWIMNWLGTIDKNLTGGGLLAQSPVRAFMDYE